MKAFPLLTYSQGMRCGVTLTHKNFIFFLSECDDEQNIYQYDPNSNEWYNRGCYHSSSVKLIRFGAVVIDNDSADCTIVNK